MTREHVLVAGCGYVGTALARRLLADGHVVLGLARDPRRLPAGVIPVTADLRRPETLDALPADVDVGVFTAAAEAHDETAYRDVYVNGLRNLLDALAARGARPRRLLFTSSTSVYGQTAGEWVDESSPTDPAGFAGRLMVEAEALVRGGPVPGTVLRLGGIYGPGRTGLLDGVRAGTVSCGQGPPRYTNRIHRDDAAGALRHLMRLAAPDELYLGVDDDPAELTAVVRWLADRVGAPPPRADAPGDDRRRGARGGNKRCTNGRLRRSGYGFRYPTFREGYAMILRGET
jgi:nucleoside-diphosphate-sugar epimerase